MSDTYYNIKDIVSYYLKETSNPDDLRIKQIEHKIDILDREKERIQSQLDNLKSSIEHLKDKKQKIIDAISKLRFQKQKLKLTDKGLI